MDNEKQILRVGAGKAAIVYPDNFFPYSGFRGRYLTGVHDDIYARALFLDNGTDKMLFVSLEIGDITDEWVPEISRETELPAENIFLAATHTHTAPYANSTWGERVVDTEKTEPFCQACKDAVYSAIRAAQASARPATMRFSEGSCSVNVSRVRPYEGNSEKVTARYISAPNPHANSDKTVAVMTFADSSDRVIAYLINYAVHSAVLFRQVWDQKDGGSLVSGDLAGAAMRYVEERVPDAVALYTMGAAADQITRYTMVHSVFDADGNISRKDYGDEVGYGLVDAMGSELGEEVLRAAKSAREAETSLLKIAEITVSAMGKREGTGGPPTQIPDGFQYVPTEMTGIRLRLIKAGETALLTVPGEIVASIGSDIKAALKAQGFANAVVITQCNGALQYISDDYGYDNMTFEANMSHFMKGIGKIIAGGAVTMAKELAT
jgi:hypothetical protein